MEANDVYAILSKKIKSIVSNVKSCTVEGTTIKWTFNDNSTTTMTFPTPKDGEDGNDGSDGISISDVNIDNNHLIVSLSDGTDIDAGPVTVDVNNVIPLDAGIDYSWWSSKSAVGSNVYTDDLGNGVKYFYNLNNEGFFAPLNQGCDIYQVGILSDGTTNNATARIFNQIPSGNLQLMDGMFVAVAGGENGNNRWHSYDGNTGGHVFEGWSNDGKHRLTMLLNEPKRTDGMKEAAIFAWDRRMNDFGWLRLGCDGMYTKNSDGSYTIQDNDKEGLSVTRSFAIAHTPVMFEPMGRPVYMPEFVPGGLQTDATRNTVGTGTVYLDDTDNKIKIKIGNKWYNFILEEDSDYSENTPTTVEVSSITLSKSTETLNNGDTLTLTATISPSNATNKSITWCSSDTSVATVSEGVITSVGTGTTTITAKSNNNKMDTCTITVVAYEEPDEPSVDGLTLLASDTGLSKDYTITDGNTLFATFKWGEADYIVTSSRAIGYVGNQFRTRPQIATNVYENGVLKTDKTTSDGDSQVIIAWGIEETSIKCNHNLVGYMNDKNTNDDNLDSTFTANYN